MSAPGSETQRRLTNQDFRTIAMTPRANQGDGSFDTPSRFAHLDPTRTPGSGGFARPAKMTKEQSDRDVKKLQWLAAKRQREKEMQEKNYRDRAEERRLGHVPPEENDPTLSVEALIKPEEKEGKSAEELRRLEIERSKFLGGTVEHTHLVKGLDYALLAKVKADLEKEEKEKMSEKAKEVQSKATTSTEAEDIKFGKVLSRDKVIKDLDSETFKTHMGRSIYEFVFNRQTPETIDHFLPGRTCFLFELDEESTSELPTIVKRAKDDCDKGRELIIAKTNTELLGKLTKIMVYYHQGAKALKKLRKKEKEERLAQEKVEVVVKVETQVTQPQVPIEEDDSNIFDDVDMSDVKMPVPVFKPLNEDEEEVKKIEIDPMKLARTIAMREMALHPEKRPKTILDREEAYDELYAEGFTEFGQKLLDEDEQPGGKGKWRGKGKGKKKGKEGGGNSGKLNQQLQKVESIIEKQAGGKALLRGGGGGGGGEDEGPSYSSRLSSKRGRDEPPEGPAKKFKAVEEMTPRRQTSGNLNTFFR